MAFPNSPPTRHSMRMHPLCSWRQWFSPPFPLTGAGMRARRHSVDQPHVEVRLAGLSAGQPRQREIFHRTQGLKPTEMAFPHSPPTRHSTRMCPPSAAGCAGALSLSFSPARAWEGRGLSLNRPLSLLPGCCHASTWRRGWPWRASRPSRKRCGAGSCPRTKVSSEIAPREHGAWV